MDDSQIIAGALIAARKSGRALDAFPLGQPAGLEQSYDIQEHEVRNLADGLAGWKIAAIKPELWEHFGAKRLAGPIVRLIDARLAPDRTVEVRVVKGGFAAVEAEFALLIGQTLPIRAEAYSEAELSNAVRSFHIASEIAGSPLPNLSDLGPTAVISDHGNNAAIVIGDEIVDWRQQPIDTLTGRTAIDGEIVGEGSAERFAGGPLGALAFLVEHLARRGRFLKAGDWVSTGATTGVHRILPGALATLDFAFAGKLSIRIVTQPEH